MLESSLTGRQGILEASQRRADPGPTWPPGKSKDGAAELGEEKAEAGVLGHGGWGRGGPGSDRCGRERDEAWETG